MRLCLLSLLAATIMLCKINPVYADMPFYQDDEEFHHCTKVSDWDTCVREETHRDLNDVKRLYQNILGNQQILKWHKVPAENTEILRDMYESWTAFRNRLCSLSNKAGMYLERLVTEKYACNAYYTKHHKDHLERILELMTGNFPKKRTDFKFLELSSHDEEYEQCVANPEKRNCIDEELQRSATYIKDLYKTFSEDEYVGKWNNGPDLSKGNYRDMYDSWIAYRNRICALSVWAYKEAYGEDAITLNQCLQYFNREKVETMENLLFSAHSSLDIGVEEEDDSVDGPEKIDYSLLPKDDGGEAEGKTIEPLQRRIDASIERAEDVMEAPKSAKKAPTSTAEEKTEPQKPSKNIPTWAKQR